MAVASYRHDPTPTAKAFSILAHSPVQLSKGGGALDKKSPVLMSVTPVLLTFSDCIGGEGTLTEKLNLSELATVYYNPTGRGKWVALWSL